MTVIPWFVRLYEEISLSLNHGLSASTGDNPLAKARGLSPRTGGQTML